MNNISLNKRRNQNKKFSVNQVDSNWDTVESAVNTLNNIKLEDAPNDGKEYARKNKSWSEIVMPNIDQSLFPNGIEIVTTTRNFLSTDAGKLLVLTSDTVGLKLPNSIVWNEEVNFGVLSVAELNYFHILYQAPDEDPDDMPMYRSNCVVLPTSTGREAIEIVMCYSQLDANTGNTTNRLNLPSTGIIIVEEGEKYEHYETTTKVVQSGGIGGGSAFTDGGATNTLTFDSSKWYGTSIAPITNSSILFDLTNAVSGSQAIVYHRSHIEPIYDTGTIKIGRSTYFENVTNVLRFTFLNNNEILLKVDTISAWGSSEVNNWLLRGGVASGFLLNALHTFFADIQPMRHKIVRFNPLWGETFASIFVPLIVNTDGGITPIGGAIDTNVGFVQNDWTFWGGGNGTLYNNSTIKYLNPNLNPSLVAEFGQDDMCLAARFYPNLSIFFQNHNTQSLSTIFAQNYHNNTIANNKVAINSAQISNIPNFNLLTNASLYFNRVSNSEIEVWHNNIKYTENAPSSPILDSNLIVGSYSPNTLKFYGYLISKGLTPPEIALFDSAWNALMSKIGK